MKFKLSYFFYVKLNLNYLIQIIYLIHGRLIVKVNFMQFHVFIFWHYENYYIDSNRITFNSLGRLAGIDLIWVLTFSKDDCRKFLLWIILLKSFNSVPRLKSALRSAEERNFLYFCYILDSFVYLFENSYWLEMIIQY